MSCEQSFFCVLLERLVVGKGSFLRRGICRGERGADKVLAWKHSGSRLDKMLTNDSGGFFFHEYSI